MDKNHCNPWPLITCRPTIYKHIYVHNVQKFQRSKLKNTAKQ